MSPQINIFVTGSNGFIGSYIVKALLECGYRNITCLVRIGSSLDLLNDVKSELNLIEGDILDIPFLEEALQHTDIIIHAAATVTFSVKNRKKLLSESIAGTGNLVNVALDKGIKKFIHISSVAALGRKKMKEQIDEKTIFSHSQFDTTYGLSKFLAEQEVWRGYAEGLNTLILNPSMVLGAGHWGKSSVKIFNKIYRGLSYYPTGSTGWVDVRDVSRAVILCITTQLSGERIIISGENLPYKKVMDTIADQLNVHRPKKKLSGWRATLLWRFEALKSLFFRSQALITKETVLSTSTNSMYANNKSIELLGMTYRPIEKTIQDCTELFKHSIEKGQTFSVFNQ